MFVDEMPPRKKRKKEILVDTSGVSPRKREEELLKDTTGIESYHVSRISTKVGRLLSGLMAVVGVLFLVFSLYLFVGTQFSFQGFEALFSGILGFLGVVNVLCGLILLAKE